jgi:hypothetical protein
VQGSVLAAALAQDLRASDVPVNVELKKVCPVERDASEFLVVVRFEKPN